MDEGQEGRGAMIGPRAGRWGLLAMAVLGAAVLALPAWSQGTPVEMDSAAARRQLVANVHEETMAAQARRIDLAYRAAALGVDVPGVLVSLLRDPDPDVRANAIGALNGGLLLDSGQPLPDSTFVLLQRALADSSVGVRAPAVELVRSYASSHAASAMRALAGALEDSTVRVRKAAIFTLQRLDSTGIQFLPRIIEMARADSAVRPQAIGLLRQLGPRATEALPVLVELAGSPDQMSRLQAVSALGPVLGRGASGPGAADAVAVLQRASRSADPDMRTTALAGLAGLGPAGAAYAARGLRDSDVHVAAYVARHLAQVQPSAPVIAALVKALGDSDAELRGDAADALGSLGESSRASLAAAASSGEARVRVAAGRGLRYLDLVRSSPVADGCFALDRGEWTPDIFLGIDSILVQTPPVIRLLTREARPARHPGEPVPMRVIPAGADEADLFGMSWTPATKDAPITIAFSDGFSGMTMELRTLDGGQSLVGEARTFWDFSRERQTAPVTAERVPCAAAARGAGSAPSK